MKLLFANPWDGERMQLTLGPVCPNLDASGKTALGAEKVIDLVICILNSDL